MTDRTAPDPPPPADDEGAKAPDDPTSTGDAVPPAVATDEAEVEPRDPTGGPTTLGWWLDDGPDSPIAADIKEPEKHL